MSQSFKAYNLPFVECILKEAATAMFNTKNCEGNLGH
jgi:hypothetical protein